MATDIQFISFLKKLNVSKKITSAAANALSREKFDKGLRDLVKETMTTAADSVLEEMFTLIDKVYHKLFKNPNTLDNYFSQDVRVPISVRFGVNSPEHKMSKELAALDYTVKGKLIKDAKAKVFDKNQNTVQSNSKDIIEIIQNNVLSDDPMRKAVALLIASGSRPIELFERSNYKAIDDTWIEQDNIAKKKGEAFSVKKPLIYLNTTQFINELKYVRTTLKARYKHIVNPKTGQLSATINTAANKATKAIFEGREGFTLYIARKLYGNLSYDLYGKNKNTIHGNSPNLQVWLSLVLGHAAGSVSASHNYSHVSLAPDTTLPDELKRKQDLIEVKLENIEERLDELNVPQPPAPNISKITVDRAKYERYEPKIRMIYDANNAPSQSRMEKLTLGVVPRSFVRQFMKLLK